MSRQTEITKAQARRDSAAGRLEEFRAALAALDAAKPDEADIDLMLAFEERRGAAEARVRIAGRALEVAETALRGAEAAAAELSKDRAHAEAEKAAAAAAVLAREVEADSEALAAKLARLEEARAAIDKANGERGERPFIVDGERQAREIPAHETPAVFGEVEEWRDAQGNRPGQYRTRPDGTAIDMSGTPLRKVMETVCVRQARFEPAHMPARFAEAIKLVDLNGARLWPK